MAKIAYLFALIACVQVATALECYSCDANTCMQDQSKWQKVSNCGKTVSQSQNIGACLKQTYMDRNTNKEMTIRKCVIADKASDGKPTYRCNENEGKVVDCQVCTGDYCNSAPAVSFSFITLLGVVAAYLIPKYM